MGLSVLPLWSLHPKRTLDELLLFSRSVISDSFATPWTVAHQVPLSIDFSGKNPGVDWHFFLQGIFSTQGLNPSVLHFLHWQADSFTTGPPGKHVIMGSIHFSPSWREFQHLHNSSKDMAQKAVYNSWGRTKDLWLHWMAKVLFLSCLTDFLSAFPHLSA